MSWKDIVSALMSCIAENEAADWDTSIGASTSVSTSATHNIADESGKILVS